MHSYYLLAEVTIAPMSFTTGFFLFLAVGMALAFEFVNGFHDTANAVATVIYTHSLKDKVAVVWSGLWNLMGVLASNGAVAFGIVSLLPVELVLNVGSAAGFAMVFSLLLSAIIWNVGTWYFGLPASSSHTLIGSIMGVGIGNAIMNGRPMSAGINWTKATEVAESLLISPLVGFVCAAALLLLAKALIKKPELYQAPDKDKAPPLWIRSILIATCTGVSYFHGSNDGQKGMGLIMLILVGILPSSFALKMSSDAEALRKMSGASHALTQSFEKRANGVTVTEKEATTELFSFVKASGKLSDKTFAALAEKNRENVASLDKVKTFDDLTEIERRDVRENFYLTASAIDKLTKTKQFPEESEAKAAKELKQNLDRATKYVPDWVKVAIALALGLGTMIGYKRIVVTVGEKIGKAHLTYATIIRPLAPQHQLVMSIAGIVLR